VLAAALVAGLAAYGAVRWATPGSVPTPIQADRAPGSAGTDLPGAPLPTEIPPSIGSAATATVAGRLRLPRPEVVPDMSFPSPTPPPLPSPPAPDNRSGAAPASRALRSFDRGPGERREVLFSFDAGSETSGAAEILDTLREQGIFTTFFLTGEFIRRHPDLVRRIAADGHEVGNHTDSHLHLTLWETRRNHVTRPDVDRRRLSDELERTAAAFRQATGREMAPLWRAPYGEYNQEILRWAADGGWAHVGWTRHMDTLDWVSEPGSRIYRDPEEIANRVLAFPRDDAMEAHGTIILMHLGSGRPHEEQLSRTLPRILDGYRQMGFEFVTASDMMRGF
jgi:peptidoglycan/xylan/chitin deacetylase (PgdA/CDA1 family)